MSKRTRKPGSGRHESQFFRITATRECGGIIRIPPSVMKANGWNGGDAFIWKKNKLKKVKITVKEV